MSLIYLAHNPIIVKLYNLNKQQNCWGSNNNKIKNKIKNPYLLDLIRNYLLLPSKNTSQMDMNIKDGPRKSYNLKLNSQHNNRYKILTKIHQKYNNLFHHHKKMKICYP